MYCPIYPALAAAYVICVLKKPPGCLKQALWLRDPSHEHVEEDQYAPAQSTALQLNGMAPPREFVKKL